MIYEPVFVNLLDRHKGDTYYQPVERYPASFARPDKSRRALRVPPPMMIGKAQADSPMLSRRV